MYKKLFSLLIAFATVGAVAMPAMLAVAATSTSITPPVMNFSAVAKSATSITLSWDTPQFVDGASFDISYSLSSSGTGTSVSGAPLPISGTHQSFDVSNLSSSGTTYYFSIRIIGANGVNSLPKVASATTQTAVTTGGIPPVMNLAMNASQTYADISWDTPQYADATKFEVVYSTNELNEANFASGTEVMNLPSPVTNTSQGTRISGLQPATLYYVGVRMLNASGASSPTSFASGTTLNSTSGGGSAFIVPPVMNLIASPKSNTEVVLTWDTPIYLGNDSFEVVYSTSPIADGTFDSATAVANLPAAVPGSQQSMSVSGLSQNTLYYFGVRLVNLSNIHSVGAYTSATTKNDGAAVGGGGTGGGGTGGSNYDGRIGAFVGVAPLISLATTTLSNPLIVINNGAATTNNQLVNLSITANGCSEMMIANDADFSNGIWEGFATTTRWILEAGSGTRTVYGKCRAGNVISGVGTSSIVLTMPEVIAATTPSTTAEVSIASGSDMLMSIAPNLLTVPSGKEIVVALTANPNGMAYAAQARISYPKDSLTLTKVEYAKGWVPEFGTAANTEDVVNGAMTKSARFPEGFSAPKHFATLTFVSTQAGTGRISIATNNVHVIPGISQTSGVGVLGSDATHGEYLMANMLSIVNEGTYSSIFTLLALLIVVYMAYLGARDKRRHGKAWVVHPSFKAK